MLVGISGKEKRLYFIGNTRSRVDIAELVILEKYSYIMPQLATIVAAILAFSAIFGQAKGNSSPVRNFKEVTRNSANVTFSWYVDSAYTSYINYFRIYARRSYPGESSYGYSHSDYVPASSTVQITSGSGTTYKYEMAATEFDPLSQYYIIWVRVYIATSPYSIYSEQILTQLGIATGAYIVFEMKIKLWTGQACFELLFSASSSDVANEVYRALRIHCQCTFEFINFFRVVPGYFNCAPTGYITYRAHLTTSDASHQPSSLVSTLSNWLHNPTINNITINGLNYTVGPGDCGVTVPEPYCSSSTSDDDPTTANPALNSATASSQAVVSSDNAAVIIAAVFATMFFILTLGLIGYILAIRRPFKKVSSQASSPPQEIPRSDPTPNPYFNNSGPSAGSSATITGASVNRQRPPIARGPLPCKPDQDQEAYEPLRV